MSSAAEAELASLFITAKKCVELHQTLIEMGFERCWNDMCLFYRKNEKGEAVLCVYVDDSFAAGDEEALDDVEEKLSEKFNIKVIKKTDEYLGCKIEKMKDGITVLSQPDLLKQMKVCFWEKVKDVVEHITTSPAGYKIHKIKE